MLHAQTEVGAVFLRRDRRVRPVIARKKLQLLPAHIVWILLDDAVGVLPVEAVTRTQRLGGQVLHQNLHALIPVIRLGPADVLHGHQTRLKSVKDDLLVGRMVDLGRGDRSILVHSRCMRRPALAESGVARTDPVWIIDQMRVGGWT